ncbi:hypothetical protein ILUMI_11311 [Ignelater luminosus]|uniref:PH domain-containing protein n=1 Tax=Ignelater luminosus TaxID=2038154 RepID=A0A8K0CWH1_IGNLU|nr:hypothetical protein ILUMI_11311 [Ignelater luminosus]
MPTEVAMANHASSVIKNPEPSPVCSETKSGSLTLIAMNGRRQGVNVKVYRTSLEHFAVLYPQKKICRPLGVINLRHTNVETLNDKQQPGFKVRQQGYDTPMTLTFLCESPRDLDSWLVAFTSRCSPTLRHQSSLPIVEEDEEQ